MTIRDVLGLLCVFWFAGWLVFCVLFVRDRRRAGPDRWLEFFPWDRIFLTGFWLWWADLYGRLRDRRPRRDRDR